MIKNGLICLSVMVLSACGSAPIIAEQPQKSLALLASNNTTQCHEQLVSYLEKAVGKPVTVSASVFSSEPRLLLEQGLSDGMSLAKPKVFNLLNLNQQCFLADEQNQQIALSFCICQSVSK